MTTLSQLIEPEHLEALARPIEEASGLPSSVYTDPLVFELEREKLFKRHWTAAGFAHEILEPGDAIPVETAGVPIILVRGNDHVVRAFVNVCRHRASTVLQAPVSGRKTLICPFHSWTYELDGRLKAAPYWDGSRSGGQPDADEHALLPVSCEVWENLIFVNLDADAAPLKEALAPILDRWQTYGLSKLTPVHTAEAVIPANWKIVIEGFLEPYHEQWVHKNISMRLDADGNRTWSFVTEDHVIGLVDQPISEGDDHPISGLTRVPGMPVTGPAPTELLLLFPTTSLNLLDDHWVQTIWSPVSVKETRWRSTWYFAEEDDAKRAAQRDVIDFWLKVRGEDLEVVLSTQRGHEVGLGTPIRFSPFWEYILQYFQRHIVARCDA